MKYSASPLTPFFAALPRNAPVSLRCHRLVTETGKPRSSISSIACTLLNSLAAFFATPLLCFQSLANSFAKTPGVGVPRMVLRDSARIFLLTTHHSPLFPVFSYQQLTSCASPSIYQHVPLFMHLRIPFSANSFFSHRYKLPWVSPMTDHSPPSAG